MFTYCLTLRLKARGDNKVCWIQSIYGHLQASQNWFFRLSASLKHYGFVRSVPCWLIAICISVRQNLHGVVSMWGLHLTTRKLLEACLDFKSYSKKHFHIGGAQVFLRIIEGNKGKLCAKEKCIGQNITMWFPCT